MKRCFAVALLLLPAFSFAEENAIVQQLLATTQTTAGQSIEVPAHPKLEISRLTIAPGKGLPVHKHPYPRYAYIEKGEIDVTLVEEKRTLHFRAGDAFAEAIGNWHYGVNPGKTPVTLIVIDQTPQDAKTNTVMREPDRR